MLGCCGFRSVVYSGFPASVGDKRKICRLAPFLGGSKGKFKNQIYLIS